MVSFQVFLQLDGRPVINTSVFIQGKRKAAIPSLLDTGSNSTFLSYSLVKELGLCYNRTTEDGKSPYGRGLIVEIFYGLELRLYDNVGNHHDIFIPECKSLVNSNYDHEVIIGTDVLIQGTLFYNGPNNGYTLNFEPQVFT
jgi:hypothetical protein